MSRELKNEKNEVDGVENIPGKGESICKGPVAEESRAYSGK